MSRAGPWGQYCTGVQLRGAHQLLGAVALVFDINSLFRGGELQVQVRDRPVLSPLFPGVGRHPHPRVCATPRHMSKTVAISKAQIAEGFWHLAAKNHSEEMAVLVSVMSSSEYLEDAGLTVSLLHWMGNDAPRTRGERRSCGALRCATWRRG